MLELFNSGQLNQPDIHVDVRSRGGELLVVQVRRAIWVELVERELRFVHQPDLLRGGHDWLIWYNLRPDQNDCCSGPHWVDVHIWKGSFHDHRGNHTNLQTVRRLVLVPLVHTPCLATSDKGHSGSVPRTTKC